MHRPAHNRPPFRAGRVARSRDGVATVLAVALMLLIGSAMLALTALLHHVADQTRATRRDAQLRQMLTAGAAVARHHIEQGGASDRPGQSGNGAAAEGDAEPDSIEATVSQTVDLPAALADRSGELRLRYRPRGQGPTRVVRVEASLEGRTSHQTLRFVERDAGGWRVAEARLNGEIPE